MRCSTRGKCGGRDALRVPRCSKSGCQITPRRFRRRRSLLDLVVSRPKPEVEPGLGEAGAEGFDLSTLTTAQLRRYLALTDESVIEHLDSTTLAEKVERVVDVAERFMADPRDVTPSEVTQARALLASMHHYDDALAPIRSLRVDWKQPLGHESDIPPAPRWADEGA
jgi:hypothetical protein